jgi:allantoate deiminase
MPLVTGGAGVNRSRVLGDEVMARLDALAACSETPGTLTRTYLSPAHRQAIDLVLGWMDEAGMSARVDAAANVVGRYEGIRPGGPALLLGSHLDTVRDAGRYDGMLGVLSAIAVVKWLHGQGRRLPFAVEVVAFGDEEGARFGTALIGSRAVAGTLDPVTLASSDGQGITLAEALRVFGLDPASVGRAARRRDEVVGYLELHIEQGPVLEAEGLPVGVVSAIIGATRLDVTFVGTAGHAGSVPMASRRDALAGAAEAVLAVERRCRGEEGLVGTVGQLGVVPGAANVIPGRARLSVDIRAPEDAARRRAVEDVLGELERIAGRRGLDLTVATTHEAATCRCSPRLIERLEAAVARHQLRPLRLVSAAGHDAMAMAALTEVGMLFVRCRGGISHHPAEAVSGDDVLVANEVLADCLLALEPPSRKGMA